MIPASRLAAKNERITQLETELAAERTARQKAIDEYNQHRVTATEEAAMLRAGIRNEEDMALVRFRHSRLPEGERPPLPDFVAGPARQDTYLSALFGGAPAAQPPPPVAPPPAPTGAVNAGVQPTPTGQTRTVKWFMGLSDTEKNAIPKAERSAGLSGGWPLG